MYLFVCTYVGVHMYYTYIFICVYIFLCTYLFMYMCLFVWGVGSQVNTRQIYQLLSTLFFETGFLSEPRTHRFVWIG